MGNEVNLISSWGHVYVPGIGIFVGNPRYWNPQTPWGDKIEVKKEKESLEIVRKLKLQVEQDLVVGSYYVTPVSEEDYQTLLDFAGKQKSRRTKTDVGSVEKIIIQCANKVLI